MNAMTRAKVAGIAALTMAIAGCGSSSGATAAANAGGAGGAGGVGGSAGSPKTSTAPCADPAFVGKPFGLRCGFMVDESGRPTFLRGVNARVKGVFDVTFDDGRLPLEPIPAFTADDAAAMRDFGFDALRLPINWSGIQPTSFDSYDEAYLGRVQATIDAARSAGVRVLLDLHQDAWSKEFGEDGAPRWALYPPPGPMDLLGGPLNDLGARRMSQIVENQFSTFFSAGPIGPKVRNEFIAMAATVAKRWANDDAVIGLEIFNEPLADSNGLLLLYGPAYAAVRPVMPQKLFVFEPSSTRNFFDKAPLGAGAIGPGTLYAPHTYKLAFDGAGSNDAGRMTMTKDTVRPQVMNAVDEAQSWGAGLMITEYGYAPTGIRSDEYLTWQSELHEEAMASSFFWLWKEESQGSWGCFDGSDEATWTPRPAMQKVLARVRPSAVSGWPKAYAFDRAKGAFTLTFTSDPTIDAPTLVAIAKVLGAPTAVTCDGATVTATPDAHGTLSLDCGRGDGKEHTIAVSVAPLPLAHRLDAHRHGGRRVGDGARDLDRDLDPRLGRIPRRRLLDAQHRRPRRRHLGMEPHGGRGSGPASGRQVDARHHADRRDDRPPERLCRDRLPGGEEQRHHALVGVAKPEDDRHAFDGDQRSRVERPTPHVADVARVGLDPRVDDLEACARLRPHPPDRRRRRPVRPGPTHDPQRGLPAHAVERERPFGRPAQRDVLDRRSRLPPHRELRAALGLANELGRIFFGDLGRRRLGREGRRDRADREPVNRHGPAREHEPLGLTRLRERQPGRGHDEGAEPRRQAAHHRVSRYATSARRWSRVSCVEWPIEWSPASSICSSVA